MARIHWSKPISRVAGDYLAWPTVTATRSGQLLVAFSGDREEHVCPYGKVVLIRSSDGGESWTDPTVIRNSPLDDRDSGIIHLASGTLLVSTLSVYTAYRLDRYRAAAAQGWLQAGDARVDYFSWTQEQVRSWERHCAKVSAADVDRWRGHWTLRSTDGGQSWEEAVDSIVSSPHGPVEARDGRLLYVGTRYEDGGEWIGCAESRDEGQSWQLIGTLLDADAHRPERSFSEPHLVDGEKDELLCVLRTDSHDLGIHTSRSTDGGLTWSPPESTGMDGFDQPGHVIRLADGRLLCTYGRRREPNGQRACLSTDEGRTWLLQEEIVLRDDAPSPDHGYPSTVELDPGELLTVYYQVPEAGEKACINATRWSL